MLDVGVKIEPTANPRSLSKLLRSHLHEIRKKSTWTFRYTKCGEYVPSFAGDECTSIATLFCC